MSSAGPCLVVGAGRVGCGFVAERMRAAGLDVTVVTRTAERAAALNRAGGAPVRLLTRTGVHDVFVGPLQAVPAEDMARVTACVARASLVTVCVRRAQLPAVAPIIAPGLAARREPVNVLVFENQADAGARLRELVTACADRSVERHGYAGVLVDRIVTAQEDGAGQPVRFVAESRIGAVVEAPPLRAALPCVAGLRPVRDYTAHVLRKLYVFSTGHAAAAYLGALHGHRDLAGAVEDLEVRAGVVAAMAEAQAGLGLRYGDAFTGGPQRRLAEVARFRNAALGDTVERVGRDPLRKLGAGERIAGPALLAAEAGVPPVTLAVVAAAALRFAVGDPTLPLDPDRFDVLALLEQCAGVPEGSLFAQLVSRAWALVRRNRSFAAVRAALLADLGDALLQVF